jgi:hypothetical protein
MQHFPQIKVQNKPAAKDEQVHHLKKYRYGARLPEMHPHHTVVPSPFTSTKKDDHLQITSTSTFMHQYVHSRANANATPLAMGTMGSSASPLTAGLGRASQLDDRRTKSKLKKHSLHSTTHHSKEVSPSQRAPAKMTTAQQILTAKGRGANVALLITTKDNLGNLS